jgi:hypothetical protein
MDGGMDGGMHASLRLPNECTKGGEDFLPVGVVHALKYTYLM